MINNMDSRYINGIINCLSLELRNKLLIAHDDLTIAFGKKLETAIKAQLPEKEIIYFNASNEPLSAYKGYTASGDCVVMRILSKSSNLCVSLREIAQSTGCLVGGLTGPSDDMLFNVFRVPFDYLQRIADRIFQHISNPDGTTKVKTLRVTSPQGTDLQAHFSPKYKWIKCTGKLSEALPYTNLLPGEIYTFPESVDGNFAIDAFYTEFIGPDDPEVAKMAAMLALNPSAIKHRLGQTPIIWKIKEGLIKSISCEDTAIERLAKAAAFADAGQYSHRIGEFALPTNPFVRKTGGVLPDEKACLHLAHGHGYPEITNAPYQSPFHADGGMLYPTVIAQLFDNSKFILMNNGRYMPELLKK